MCPAVFGVYGESNSGKTRLIVEIIKRLTKEGFKVASIKISDKKITIDKKEKDTWKHAEAGSSLVVLSSKDETDFLIKNKLKTKKIIDKINFISEYDLIVIEGANDDFTPKIKLGKIKERKNTIITYDGDFENLIKTIKKEIIMRKNMEKISIKVNGKQIPLTEFPAEFIINTITGMLKSLKGVKEIKNVQINIKI